MNSFSGILSKTEGTRQRSMSQVLATNRKLFSKPVITKRSQREWIESEINRNFKKIEATETLKKELGESSWDNIE